VCIDSAVVRSRFCGAGLFLISPAPFKQRIKIAIFVNRSAAVLENPDSGCGQATRYRHESPARAWHIKPTRSGNTPEFLEHAIYGSMLLSSIASSISAPPPTKLHQIPCPT